MILDMLAVDLLVRVGLATVLGIAIGLERQWRSRMAGLQTMALVSMGSALFIILGAYSFQQQDQTRVAAQIVSGIGFLGAGVIMKQGLSVTGLNTAATLWSTAAVGALAGAWMWREAITGAAIIIAGNGLLQPLAEAMDRKSFRLLRDTPPADYILEATCRADDERDIRTLMLQEVTGPRIHVKSVGSFATKSPDEVLVRCELTAGARDDKLLEAAVSTLSMDPRVSSVRWTIAREGAANWTN